MNGCFLLFPPTERNILFHQFSLNPLALGRENIGNV